MTDFLENSVHRAIREHLRRQERITDEEIYRHLFPKLTELPSPFLMSGMDRAVELVLQAMAEGADIIVWGDYDVDGITSVALLVLFFRELGYESVQPYIPDRLSEGYGLSEKALKRLAAHTAGSKLLITVDCGISSFSEVALAKKLGFSVIVTDHHTVPEQTIEADAVLNPRQAQCGFPFKFLAGVGVAFYLAAGIRAAISQNKNLNTVFKTPNLKYFMAFVSLGTIADIMPLVDVNRLLAKAGFEAIADGNCPEGVKEVFEEVVTSRKPLFADSIAYQLAPTVNSAGRLGEPMTALKALIEPDGVRRKKHIKRLVTLNKQRKKLAENDLEIALGIARIHLINHNNSIVIQGCFMDGILGITASRLVEQFHKPAIVFCTDPSQPEYLKGSGRAPAGFDLFKIVRHCSRFLSAFGGHPSAAGMTIKAEHFELFQRAFDEQAGFEQESINISSGYPEKSVPLSVSEALDPILLNNLVQLEPLGEENPKPFFIDDAAQFVTMTFFGRNREHLRGVLRGRYRNIPVLGFYLAEKAALLNLSEPCTLVYSLLHDNFNGSNQWKIKVQDVWPNGQ